MPKRHLLPGFALLAAAALAGSFLGARFRPSPVRAQAEARDVEFRTVTAQALNIVGDNGALRIQLAAPEGNPGVLLLDDGGQTRASVFLDADGPQVLLKDEAGQTRAAVSVTEEAGVALWGQGGSNRVLLSEDTLSLFDRDGQIRASMTAQPGGGRLGVSAPDGAHAASLRATAAGASFELSADSRARVRAVLEEGGGLMELASAEGDTRARLEEHGPSAGLSLYDGSAERLRLSAGGEFTGLAARDADGVNRAVVQAGEEGANVSLLDANGQARAEFNALGDGPGMLFLDASGKTRAQIGAFGGAPSMALFDGGGAPRAEMSLTGGRAGLLLRDGSRTPRLALSAEEGAARASLLDAEGASRLLLQSAADATAFSLFSPEGAPRVTLTETGDAAAFALMPPEVEAGLRALARPGESRLALSDASGAARAELGLPETGPAVTLRDGAGRDRAIMGATKLVDEETGEERVAPASTLVLVGPDETVAWQAP